MRKSLFVLTGLLAGLGAAAQPGPPGPSFDCAHAATPIEKAICADGDDTAGDRDLARSYKKVMAGLKSDADKAALRDSQRAWVRQRDAACAAPKPPQTVGLCLRPFYAQRLKELDNWGSAGLSGTMVPDDALAAAYGKDRADVNFSDAAFSPDQKLLAFAAGVGDNRSVWLYDSTGRKLLAVSAVPPHGGNATMGAFYWVGATLYGEGQSNAANAAPAPFRFAATMAGSRKIDKLPPAPVIAGEPKDTTDANAAGGERSEEGGRFGVASASQGHGAFTLTASDAKSEWTIEKTGGWELSGFLFDAQRSRVLYDAPANGALTLYNLVTRRKAAYAAPPGKILTVSADGGVAVIATYQPCQGAILADPPRTQHLCLITLPR
ncbi:MAG TPA: lysozyme inhibitor LprI family protein [Rhizomicrobium sp.]